MNNWIVFSFAGTPEFWTTTVLAKALEKGQHLFIYLTELGYFGKNQSPEDGTRCQTRPML